jgi:hypothetical protein
MIRTQVLLTETQYELAKRHAAMKGMSLSAFVRRALDKVLAKKKSKSPASVLLEMAKDSVKGLPKDLGSNDDYLYKLP